MSFINKFAWSGAAVVLAAVLMLGIMAPRAEASVASITGGVVSISVAPAVLTATGPGTSTTITPIVITSDSNAILSTVGVAIFLAPTGWAWDSAVAPTIAYSGAGAASIPATTTAGLTGGYNSASGATCTTTATTATCRRMQLIVTTAQALSTTLTITGAKLIATGNTSASGTVTIDPASTSNVAGSGGTSVFVVTATVPASGAATQISLVRTLNATACGAVNPVTASTTTLPSDGSTGSQLCASLTDAAGMPVGGVPVTFTASVGYVSTGTGKTTVAFTSAAGNATTNYRGAGSVATTDTVVASVPALSLVASPLSVTLAAPVGGTATKIAILTPAVIGLAPLLTNVPPAYSSPTTATNVAIQVTDVSGLGVNAQSVQVTVDRGGLVANPAFATVTQTALQALCTATPAKSIIVTTVGTDLLSPGGAATPGAGNFVVCTNQVDAAGKITVTASNITTTMSNATLTLAQAGRPAKINIKVDGSTINATVVDAAGNVVADGTPISFTISSTVGAVSTTCTTTANGAATTVVALTGATGNVLVSTNWNETGVVATGSTCAAAGTQTLASNVSLPSGTAAGTGSGAPAAGGTGALVGTGTVPATGFGLIVFGGGTVAQLVTATKCPAATAAYFVTDAAGFVTYVPGTSIAAVNAPFLAMFPGGNISANTALIGKCA